MPKLFAYHFDLKRPQWTPAYMAAMVDRLRAWGFNAILYEIEDKFRFTRHPAVSHAESPSHDEIRAFVAACRGRGVEVIPMMQSLGHAECVLTRPGYEHLREAPEVNDQYDPLSDEARRVIVELFDEIIDVFGPSEFFHMGGDETLSLGSGPRSQPVLAELGIGGLYLHHMMPIFEHIRSRGLRPMIWADIVLSHPGMIRQIPRDVVLIDWDYVTGVDRGPGLHIHGGGKVTSPPAHRASIWGMTWAEYQQYENAEFREHFERFAIDERTRRDGTFDQFYCMEMLRTIGLDAVTASATRSAGDTAGVPRLQGGHLPNCFCLARGGMRTGIGNIVTSWAVRHNHPELGLPAAFAAAYALSHDDEFDAVHVLAAFTEDFFGRSMPEFAEAIEKAQESFPLSAAGASAKAEAALAAGEDPAGPILADAEKWAGGRDAAADRIRDILADHERARGLLQSCRGQARRNARNLDFWLEGLDANDLAARFLQAVLAGRLDEDRKALGDRLADLRGRTASLFAQTYCPGGVADEVRQRYGFFERLLLV